MPKKLEAEEFIKKSFSIAFDYAEDVIKGRWKEAEELILNGKKNSLEYCLLHNIRLPEAVHNKVMAEIAFGNKVPNLELKKKYMNRIK